MCSPVPMLLRLPEIRCHQICAPDSVQYALCSRHQGELWSWLGLMQIDVRVACLWSFSN